MAKPKGLNAQRALVTGGTSGIGRATAEALAREGAHVLISGRSEVRGVEVVAAIKAGGGEAEFVHANLESPDDVRALAQRAAEVDILVNNAGVFPVGATHELSEATFDETFAVNVKAPFLLTAAIAPKMVARGGGAIINVTTMVAEFGIAGLSAYGASKAAVALLTKAWAAEYGPRACGSMPCRPARPVHRVRTRWARGSRPSSRRFRLAVPPIPKRSPRRSSSSPPAGRAT